MKQSNEFSPAVKKEARFRSGGRCEIHLQPSCGGRAVLFHHVLRRGQGGKGTLDNCLHLCNWCHAYVHANPAISYENGWLRRSGQL